jgi:hypothetical protein
VQSAPLGETASAVERINPIPFGLGNGLDSIESSDMPFLIAMWALVHAVDYDEQSKIQNSFLSVQVFFCRTRFF